MFSFPGQGSGILPVPHHVRSYAMKFAACTICLAVLALPLFAGNPPESKSTPAFDMMKSLEGSWEGDGPDGKTVHISYKVVSAGSAVMETIDHSEMEAAMVTVYHLDKDKLMMTHYCSAGQSTENAIDKKHADVAGVLHV